jgi:hypothetical protein
VDQFQRFLKSSGLTDSGYSMDPVHLNKYTVAAEAPWTFLNWVSVW